MSTPFTYADEADKAFGLTGMVICLNVCDADHALESLTLDAAADEETFVIDSHYTDGGECSPAAPWRALVEQYKLLCSLAASNVLCRMLVHRHRGFTNDTARQLRDQVSDTGRDMCDLADDEIDDIFTRSLGQMMRVFREPQVHTIATRYAAALRQRRSMSRAEAFELLQSLL